MRFFAFRIFPLQEMWKDIPPRSAALVRVLLASEVSAVGGIWHLLPLSVSSLSQTGASRFTSFSGPCLLLLVVSAFSEVLHAFRPCLTCCLRVHGREDGLDSAFQFEPLLKWPQPI